MGATLRVLVIYFAQVLIATVTCVKTQAKPKRRMAALRAAIRLLGFMS